MVDRTLSLSDNFRHMDPLRERNPLPLEYAPPSHRRSGLRRAAPYAVFVVSAFLAGLFASWLPYPSGMEFTLWLVLTVFFGLGAVVLPILIQRDNL